MNGALAKFSSGVYVANIVPVRREIAEYIIIPEQLLRVQSYAIKSAVIGRLYSPTLTECLSICRHVILSGLHIHILQK